MPIHQINALRRMEDTNDDLKKKLVDMPGVQDTAGHTNE